MPKNLKLHDSVEVDDVDLSRFARSVRFGSEHARVDVSGFTASGANEYLAGPTEQSLTVEFYGSYGLGEVHATLYPIHRDRTVVPIKWRPDMNAPVGADNPELRANVMLYTYGPGGSRGEPDVLEAVFQAADELGFEFFDTALPLAQTAKAA